MLEAPIKMRYRITCLHRTVKKTLGFLKNSWWYHQSLHIHFFFRNWFPLCFDHSEILTTSDVKIHDVVTNLSVLKWVGYPNFGVSYQLRSNVVHSKLYSKFHWLHDSLLNLFGLKVISANVSRVLVASIVYDFNNTDQNNV